VFSRNQNVEAVTGEAEAACPAAAEAGGPTEAGHASPADGGSSRAAGPTDLYSGECLYRYRYRYQGDDGTITVPVTNR
jgi:hypothetical protein